MEPEQKRRRNSSRPGQFLPCRPAVNSAPPHQIKRITAQNCQQHQYLLQKQKRCHKEQIRLSDIAPLPFGFRADKTEIINQPPEKTAPHRRVRLQFKQQVIVVINQKIQQQRQPENRFRNRQKFPAQLVKPRKHKDVKPERHNPCRIQDQRIFIKSGNKRCQNIPEQRIMMLKKIAVRHLPLPDQPGGVDMLGMIHAHIMIIKCPQCKPDFGSSGRKHKIFQKAVFPHHYPNTPSAVALTSCYFDRTGFSPYPDIFPLL